ncbi:hypothetical protein PACTADRAFT_48898 [Pachysolen tannophilus NRRL Y-2460]|uniref:Eisosome protein SEG1 n=1 Tax=Pachysolen tannophilus NRRL Y-2460 TaxID=669874 RepID=A0A1E4TZE6_PACTA|nr:hypothetical protein PACTADRAFT_48898 [Pachysolen tannophilus NRRL Y-2460]
MFSRSKSRRNVSDASYTGVNGIQPGTNRASAGAYAAASAIGAALRKNNGSASNLSVPPTSQRTDSFTRRANSLRGSLTNNNGRLSPMIQHYQQQRSSSRSSSLQYNGSSPVAVTNGGTDDGSTRSRSLVSQQQHSLTPQSLKQLNSQHENGLKQPVANTNTNTDLEKINEFDFEQDDAEKANEKTSISTNQEQKTAFTPKLSSKNKVSFSDTSSENSSKMKRIGQAQYGSRVQKNNMGSTSSSPSFAQQTPKTVRKYVPSVHGLVAVDVPINEAKSTNGSRTNSLTSFSRKSSFRSGYVTPNTKSAIHIGNPNPTKISRTPSIRRQLKSDQKYYRPITEETTKDQNGELEKIELDKQRLEGERELLEQEYLNKLEEERLVQEKMEKERTELEAAEKERLKKEYEEEVARQQLLETEKAEHLAKEKEEEKNDKFSKSKDDENFQSNDKSLSTEELTSNNIKSNGSLPEANLEDQYPNQILSNLPSESKPIVENSDVGKAPDTNDSSDITNTNDSSKSGLNSAASDIYNAEIASEITEVEEETEREDQDSKNINFTTTSISVPDEEDENKNSGLSSEPNNEMTMAKALRSAIPSLKPSDTSEIKDNIQNDSLNIPPRSERRLSNPPVIPSAPSEKAGAALTRKKSALKSSSRKKNVATGEFSPSEDSAASSAYISLTTAENTRLNSKLTAPPQEQFPKATPAAYTPSKAISKQRSRSNSAANKTAAVTSNVQAQHRSPANNNYRLSLRPQSEFRSKQPQQLHSAQSSTRPSSIAISMPKQVSPGKFVLPKSEAKLRADALFAQANNKPRQSQAELAANLPPLVRKSSFEKQIPEQQGDHEDYLKYMTLRVGTFEEQQPQQQQYVNGVNDVKGYGSSRQHINAGFKSRFADSDSEDEITTSPNLRTNLAKSTSNFRERNNFAKDVSPTKQRTGTNPVVSESPENVMPLIQERDQGFSGAQYRDGASEAIPDKKKKFSKLKKLFGKKNKP